MQRHDPLRHKHTVPKYFFLQVHILSAVGQNIFLYKLSSQVKTKRQKKYARS